MGLIACMDVQSVSWEPIAHPPGRPRGSSAIGCVPASFGFLSVTIFLLRCASFLLRSRALVQTVDRRPSAAAWNEGTYLGGGGACASLLPGITIVAEPYSSSSSWPRVAHSAGREAGSAFALALLCLGGLVAHRILLC